MQTAKDQRLPVIHPKAGKNKQYCMPAPDAVFVFIKISSKIFYYCFIIIIVIYTMKYLFLKPRLLIFPGHFS